MEVVRITIDVINFDGKTLKELNKSASICVQEVRYNDDKLITTVCEALMRARQIFEMEISHDVE